MGELFLMANGPGLQTPDPFIIGGVGWLCGGGLYIYWSQPWLPTGVVDIDMDCRGI